MIGTLLAAASASANSITNGGFEAGDFTGWTVDTAPSGSLLFVGNHAHSGADAAWFGAIGVRDDSLSQTFSTLPGEAYTVTFWLSHGATDSSNDFSAWWDDSPLLALVNAPRFNTRPYSFVLNAADNETRLRFSGRALRDYYYLDDVSVMPLAPREPIPAPEVPTLALLLSGLVATRLLTALR